MFKNLFLTVRASNTGGSSSRSGNGQGTQSQGLQGRNQNTRGPMGGGGGLRTINIGGRVTTPRRPLQRATANRRNG